MIVQLHFDVSYFVPPFSSYTYGRLLHKKSFWINYCGFAVVML